MNNQLTDFYKYDEILNYFKDFISEQPEEWIQENAEDLHHHAFNSDYYIIGTYKAKKWLSDEAFDIIAIVKEYDESMFGGIYTDLSNPEKVVNMYTYIVGEQIVADYLEDFYKNKLES